MIPESLQIEVLTHVYIFTSVYDDSTPFVVDEKPFWITSNYSKSLLVNVLVTYSYRAVM